MQFKVANVKVSVKIPAIALDIVYNIAKEKNIPTNSQNNFIVLKAKYIFIIFKKGRNSTENHIHITKIPNISSISKAIKEVEDAFLNSDYQSLSFWYDCFWFNFLLLL